MSIWGTPFGIVGVGVEWLLAAVGAPARDAESGLSASLAERLPL